MLFALAGMVLFGLVTLLFRTDSGDDGIALFQMLFSALFGVVGAFVSADGFASVSATNRLRSSGFARDFRSCLPQLLINGVRNLPYTCRPET
jgi:hypothetical protein